MQYVTRAQAGLRPPRHRSHNITSRGLAVHWNGELPARCDDHSRCAKFWRGIQAFHMWSRRWSDVAYSWGVCPHGIIFEGRGWGVRTAANGTNYGNQFYHAVFCFIGQGEKPTPAMLEAVLDVRAEHAKRHGSNELTFHAAFKSTACPGSDLIQWVRSGAPVTSYDPTRDETMFVKKGDFSIAVRYWQRTLNDLLPANEQIAEDKDYGDQTAEALGKIFPGYDGEEVTDNIARLLWDKKTDARIDAKLKQAGL